LIDGEKLNIFAIIFLLNKICSYACFCDARSAARSAFTKTGAGVNKLEITKAALDILNGGVVLDLTYSLEIGRRRTLIRDFLQRQSRLY